MIIKRKNSYQVKVKDTLGQWASKTFPTKKEAEAYQARLKQQKFSGLAINNLGKHITYSEYFSQWFESTKFKTTAGWRTTQQCLYDKHIKPDLGERKLDTISPSHILEIINKMVGKDLSKQTICHAYNILAKSFQDAVDVFSLLHRSPVHKTFRPKVPKTEARYLRIEQTKKLLQHVENHPYGLAVWLGIYMGMRVGEVQALLWEDVDLKNGIIHIRRNYVKSERVFRDYPKGKKHHSQKIPSELLAKLKAAKNSSTTKLVVVPPGWQMLDYWKYRRVLKGLCREVGIKGVSIHGLRHSSSELWMEHGASRDDLRLLFAHADSATTDRYVHDRGSRLHKVADVIELFPDRAKGSQKDPTEKEEKKVADQEVV